MESRDQTKWSPKKMITTLPFCFSAEPPGGGVNRLCLAAEGRPCIDMRANNECPSNTNKLQISKAPQIGQIKESHGKE